MKTLDTKTLLVHALKENKNHYCMVKDIPKLCGYIYQQLYERDLFIEYIIRLCLDIESIMRILYFDNQIFFLGTHEDIVYFQNTVNIDTLIKEFPLDDTIIELIREFLKLEYA